MSVVQVSGKSKRTCYAVRDRISNLPSNIMERILECLPLIDAVRLSILSRRWRKKWLDRPQFMLGIDFFDLSVMKLRPGASEADLQSKYSKIVNNILLRHNDPIHFLSLYIPRGSIFTDTSQWIQFASNKGIERLCLHNGHPWNKREKLPSCLFTCVSLIRLTLLYFPIDPLPPTFVSFPHLTFLSLKVRVESGSDACALTNLISCCPLLQILHLGLCVIPGRVVTIHAPKLRELRVYGFIGDIHVTEETTMVNMLMIDAFPNSEIKLNNFIFSFPKLETIILRTLQASNWDSTELTNKLQQLTTLKLLGIPHSPWAISLALYYLRSSPHLQNLEIKVGAVATSGEQQFGDILLEFKEDCCLQHLKNVALICISGSRVELQLIKLILGCSPVLEVMTILVNKEAYEEKLKIASKLLRFGRASSKAVIVFQE